jgi:hypothetical protein
MIKMVLLINGETNVQICYSLPSEGKRESHNGYGYIIVISINDQEIHCEMGICWRNNFESLAEMGDLVTRDVVHLGSGILIREGNVLFINCNRSFEGSDLWSDKTVEEMLGERLIFVILYNNRSL